MEKPLIVIAASFDNISNFEKAIKKEFGNSLDVVFYTLSSQKLNHFEDTLLKECSLIITQTEYRDFIAARSMKPVLIFKIGISDYIKAIISSNRIKGNKAIVGSESIIKNAHQAKKILDSDISIVETPSDIQEITKILRHLSADQYMLVIGTPQITDIASEIGMQVIKINPSYESVQRSLQQAIEMLKFNQLTIQENNILKEVIGKNQLVAVFLPDKKLVFKSKTISRHFISDANLEKEVEKVMNLGSLTFFIEYNNSLFNVAGEEKRLENKHSPFVVFTIKPFLNDLSNIQGIKVTDSFPYRNDKESLFRESHRFGEKTIEKVVNYLENNMCLLLVGEKGVGKRRMAESIHRYTKLCTSPHIEIDCKLTNENGWKKFMNFFNANQFNRQQLQLTFFEIEHTPKRIQKKLYPILQNLRNTTSISIISTTASSLEKMREEDRFDTSLFELISEGSVYLPSLLENIENIESIASIYIIDANEQYNKQILGFRDEALNELKSHQWFRNYIELRRVISQAVINCTDNYLSLKDIREVFNNLDFASDTEEALFSGTLDEITERAIQYAIKAENGNVSSAAKRLGIGRSTVWRKLKRDEEIQ